MSEENKSKQAEVDQQAAKVVKHEISSITLNTLINGYLHAIKPTDEQQLIASICMEYYSKQLYIMLLNAETLQLTAHDSLNPNISISSNKFVALNESKHIAVNGVGFCLKENIKINNLSKTITQNITDMNCDYNAIFKCGGGPKKSDYFSNSYNECGILLYEQFQSTNFNSYYYELPSTPFRLREYSNPIYSDTHGLITFGLGNNTGKIATLNINQNEHELKWNIQNMSKDLFPMELKVSPAGCLINRNEYELFFTNGGKEERNENLKTAIYNLETKKCTVIHKNNPCPATECGIVYCYNRNRVYIGGGQSTTQRQQLMQYYDLNKNEYFYLPMTNKPYERPTLKIDTNGAILYICCIDSWHNDKIYFEWIDLRAQNKWNFEDSLNQFAKQLFQKEAYKTISIVNW